MFFKKVNSLFRRGSKSENNALPVDAMSAGLGLNARALSALEEQTADEDFRARDKASGNLDEATLEIRAEQHEKDRQEARLVNRFMSRTLTGDTASSAGGSDSVTSSKYSGMSDGEVLDDLGLQNDFSEELVDDKHLRRALDTLTDRLRSGAEDVEICLMEEIHAVDSARDVVNKHLLNRVLSHYDDFMKGMDHVSEVDLDLTRACIHARNARRTLAKTKHSMVLQLLDVAQKKRARKRLDSVLKLTNFIREISKVPSNVKRLISDEQFSGAIECLHDAEEALNSEMAIKLLCLRKLKPTLRDLWPYLRRKLDSALRDLIMKDVNCERSNSCMTFDQERYRCIMASYMKLDMSVSRKTSAEGRETRSDSVGLATSLGFGIHGHAYMSQYASAGPLESDGGVEGTPERLQRIYLSLVEDEIRRCVSNRLQKRDQKETAAAASVGGDGGNPFSNPTDIGTNSDKTQNKTEDDDDSDGNDRPLTPNSLARRIRSSSSVVESALAEFREQCSQLTPDDVVAVTFDMYAILFDVMRHQCVVRRWHETCSEKEGNDRTVPFAEVMRDETLVNGMRDTTPVLWKCCCDRITNFLRHVKLNFPRFRLDHATQVYNATVLFVSQEMSFYDVDAVVLAASLVSNPFGSSLNDAAWADDGRVEGVQETKEVTKTKTTTAERLQNSALVTSVQQRIVTYLGSFQRDAYDVLADFIQREAWGRLEMSLEDMGGIDGLVGRRQHAGALRQSSRMVRRLSLRGHSGRGGSSGSSDGDDSSSSSRLVDTTPSTMENPFDVFTGKVSDVENSKGAEMNNVDNTERTSEQGRKDSESSSKEDGTEEDDFQFTPLTSVERVITTSALNGFSKYIGDYLNIMEHLPSMSSIAVRGLFQLFEFYVHAVVSIFTNEQQHATLLSERDTEDVTTDSWNYPALAQLVRRVRSSGGNTVIQQQEGGINGLEFTASLATMSCAVESVRFLLEMCQALRSSIQNKLGTQAHSTATRAMFENAAIVTRQLRQFMYNGWTKTTIPKQIVIDAMKGTKWDPRDLPETFSTYTTTVTNHLNVVDVDMRAHAPPHIHSLLWKHMVDRIMLCLLDAYSTIKKCTNNGRAQMSLDLATLQRSIEQKYSGTSNQNGAMICNMFIKAYYYDSMDDFMSWLETSGQNMWGLGLKHILSLINCDKSPLSKLKRKQKQELKAKVMSSWTLFVQGKLEQLEKEPPPPPPPRPNGV